MDFGLGHDRLVGLQDHVLRDAETAETAFAVALDGRGGEAQPEAHLATGRGFMDICYRNI